LAGHTDAVYSVALSPDGQTAITGSIDLTAILWDATDRTRPRRLATLRDHHNWVNGVAFSPDGHTVANPTNIPAPARGSPAFFCLNS